MALLPACITVDVAEHEFSHNVAEHEFNTKLDRSPPFIVAFRNLTYTIKTPTSKALPFLHLSSDKNSHPPRRTLLDSISGEAIEGEILGVIGASGSGKSTLIDALADRIAKPSLGNGAVFLNGEPLESKMQKTISAYVMQDDLLFPMLTVQETLTFAAEFRLPRWLSASKKRARVQALIDQLGLRAAASTIIGDEGHRGVSGGERRRVSIGTDIIHDPILFFLDEPTSGLDSTCAFMVMKVLQRIARSGSVVVTSIHQPSARILGLLDRLLILSKGRTVFFGSTDRLSEFFAEFGRPMSEGENKAEFALDVVRELEDGPDGADKLVKFFRLSSKSFISKLSESCSIRPLSSTFTLQATITASISRGKLFAAAILEGDSMKVNLLISSEQAVEIAQEQVAVRGVFRLGVVFKNIVITTQGLVFKNVAREEVNGKTVVADFDMGTKGSGSQLVELPPRQSIVSKLDARVAKEQMMKILVGDMIIF